MRAVCSEIVDALRRILHPCFSRAVNSIGEPEASRIWSTGRSLFPRDLRRARFVPVSGVSTRYHEEEEGAA